MDEPESLGAISLAGREKLDNLIFVINCNLQRLDGPVRGNGKIVQELEAVFRGAGWNVIKCLWGSSSDELLDARQGRQAQRSSWKNASTASTRTSSRRTAPMCASTFSAATPRPRRWSPTGPTPRSGRALTRGGHDPLKVYAAYKVAVDHKGQPTVILAKTIKGYGMGEAGEGQEATTRNNTMVERHVLLEFCVRWLACGLKRP